MAKRLPSRKSSKAVNAVSGERVYSTQMSELDKHLQETLEAFALLEHIDAASRTGCPVRAKDDILEILEIWEAVEVSNNCLQVTNTGLEKLDEWSKKVSELGSPQAVISSWKRQVFEQPVLENYEDDYDEEDDDYNYPEDRILEITDVIADAISAFFL